MLRRSEPKGRHARRCDVSTAEVKEGRRHRTSVPHATCDSDADARELREMACVSAAGAGGSLADILLMINCGTPGE